MLRCKLFRRTKLAGHPVTIFRQIQRMLIGRRFSGADLGVPGKHNDPRAGPVAIKMQCHLGILAYKLQASGMSQGIDQKIGCSLIPPEPDGGGLRHPASVYCGQPHEILFLYTTPDTVPKECAVIWKLKSHASQPFFGSCASIRWRKNDRLVGSNSNTSSCAIPHICRAGTIAVIHSCFWVKAE